MAMVTYEKSSVDDPLMAAVGGVGTTREKLKILRTRNILKN